jgi:hypothetical protein
MRSEEKELKVRGVKRGMLRGGAAWLRKSGQAPGIGKKTGICLAWKNRRISAQHVGEEVLACKHAHSSLVRWR